MFSIKLNFQPILNTLFTLSLINTICFKSVLSVINTICFNQYYHNSIYKPLHLKLHIQCIRGRNKLLQIFCKDFKTERDSKDVESFNQETLN